MLPWRDQWLYRTPIPERGYNDQENVVMLALVEGSSTNRFRVFFRQFETLYSDYYADHKVWGIYHQKNVAEGQVMLNLTVVGQADVTQFEIGYWPLNPRAWTTDMTGDQTLSTWRFSEWQLDEGSPENDLVKTYVTEITY